MATKVIISCTHGAEDPDRVTVSYLTAGAALDKGHDVVMWLTIEGVRLATPGYADQITLPKAPPVERLHAQFVEKGGRFFVCPICLDGRDIDHGSLIDGAEVKGATPLMEFAGDHALTFNY